MTQPIRLTPRRLLLGLALVVLAASVSGCFPGQFPSPEPRTPPPVQTNGNKAQQQHFYGAPAPNWQSADVGAG